MYWYVTNFHLHLGFSNCPGLHGSGSRWRAVREFGRYLRRTLWDPAQGCGTASLQPFRDCTASCVRMGICHQVQLQGELETQLSFVPEHLRFMLQEARWEPASSRPTQGGQTSTQINSYCSYLSIFKKMLEKDGKGTTQKLYKHFRNSTQRLHMQFSRWTSYKQEVIAVWKIPEDLLINSSRKKSLSRDEQRKRLHWPLNYACFRYPFLPQTIQCKEE